MSRAARELESKQMVALVLKVIRKHRGKPCPSRAEIVAWTGLPRREVWPFLRGLAARMPPLIEIEERLHARAGMRRLRLPGGEWTGWTERRTPSREDHAVKRRLRREMRNGQA